ncbi:MAG: TadE family protein [Cyanobacteria bacterium RYN_339]|nr:TadE family protein [Cyanobacteria bacterium RYN_339]
MAAALLRRASARRGQALVEFALSVPIMISLFTGIIDVGFLYQHQLVLTNAVREGARLGTLGQSNAQVQAAVVNYLKTSAYTPLPAASAVSVTIAGGSATVSLSSSVPFLFSMSGPPVTLRATTQMRVE